MDLQEYFADHLARERIAEFRAAADRERLSQEFREPRPPLRVSVGTALIRLGSWITGPTPAADLNTSFRRA